MQALTTLIPLGIVALSTPAPRTVLVDDFAPAQQEGQVIRREISIVTEMELVGSSMIQNGEEVPAEFMPAITRESSNELNIVALDTLGTVDEGAATAFTREFESLSGSGTFDMSMDGEDEMGGMEPVSESFDLSSKLEEERVQFTMTDGEWAAQVPDDSELTPADVDGLDGDLSFGFLLPGEEKSEGDSWSVDASAIEKLLTPGGEMLLESGDESEMMEGLEEGMEDDEVEFEGSIELTHQGTKEVDGSHLVSVELTLDCTRTSSGTVTFMMGDEDGEMEESDSEMEQEDSYEGKGTLLFDPASGSIVSLDLELEQTSTTLMRMSFDVPGEGTIEIEEEQVEDGVVTVSVSASVEEAAPAK